MSRKKKLVEPEAIPPAGVKASSGQDEALPGEESSPFPIVGIGASAGGLEALEGFFAAMPDDGNMAFVVIQHLSPTYKSIMGEILQKHTRMPIFEVQDGMKVAPNCIYLNPSDKDVVIINRTLQLMEPPDAQRVRFAIDVFFRSLADDQGEKAVCIILSGTGSDGTLGLKAVKGVGGMAMVQEQGQAQYNGMPQSAIKTGLVDFILPVERMPGELIKFIYHPAIAHAGKAVPLETQFQNHARKVFALIRSATGHDFSNYKQTTLHRRITRRMAVHQIEGIEGYIKYLQRSPAEVELLFKEMLIGVTGFFRDTEAFGVLADKILPDMMAKKPPDAPLRVWVPGCATGEEAYSIAMLMVETMETLNKTTTVQIFASDLDAEAIDFARVAIYPENIAGDMSPERLRRFFIKDGDAYQAKKQIREMVLFAAQNLIKDPPFSRLDLICCRNVLIYMNSVLQKKIIPLFHYTLLPEGVLFLGSSESIGEFGDLFKPLNAKWKIFSRRESTISRTCNALPPFFETRVSPLQPPKKEPVGGIDVARLAEKVVLDQYAFPAVVLNEKHEILYFIGSTDRFLTPPTGEPNFNIIQMAREGLRHKLSAAIRQSDKEKRPVVVEGLSVKHSGGFRAVDVIVRPLGEQAASPGLRMVVFKERPAVEKAARKKTARQADESLDLRIADLEQELQSTREYLQTTIEQSQTSNEELKSMNEELQSVNEELQSANEELETSKEELQSTNEELVTVNAELQNKVEELTRVTSDINNLLAGTDIGTIFLDNGLRIKRFTPAITDIFHLIGSDIGRPIRDIVCNLQYDALAQDAKAVLETLNPKERELLTRDGNWHLMRIMPYRTLDDLIDGVVIIFVDITRLKKIEIAEHDAKKYAESIVETVQTPLIILDAELNARSANRAFYQIFGEVPETVEGKSIYEIGGCQWDISRLRDLLENILAKNESFDGYEMDCEFSGAGRGKIRLNARRIRQEGDSQHLILLAMEKL
ncbi:MAG: chemotaxis protein CheB [Eubacteriales bacterium]|nr:chemotaxis protein CheB [Eubacteriales bacterium]